MADPSRSGPKPKSRQAAKSGGSERTTLTKDERQKAGSGPTPPEAWVIHEVVREDGEREIRRSISSLAWSGLGAGLSMGFSFLTPAMFMADLPKTAWAHLIAALGYPIGFVIAVLGRQQLFTESTLTAVLPFLTRRDFASLVALLRLWAVVLVANLTGTMLFAALLCFPDLMKPEIHDALGDLAKSALADPFAVMMLKAILSGWLIALMVWLLPGAGPARLMLIVLLTYIVAIGQFSHMIAGSVEAAYAVFTGEAGASDYLLRFALPTLLGNTIGGVSLVAILNHAPVKDEIGEKT